MHNAWFRQRVVLQIRDEAFPTERGALATAVQPLQGHSDRLRVETLKAGHIPTNPVILIVAPQLSDQNRPPFLRRLRTPDLLEPSMEGFDLLSEFLPTRPPTHDEPPSTTRPTEVGETQEVEGMCPSLLPLGVLSFKASKADYPGLVWMEREIKPGQSLS